MGLSPVQGLAQGAQMGAQPGFFNRVATFEVPGAVAEIVAASPDGQTLVYTNAEDKQLGFVSLADPAKPALIGTLPVAGEPTSVAITPDGRWALAVIHDTDQLTVVEMATRAVTATLPLGGQPDAIALSPDGRYAAIAIENERDEDLEDGKMPQAPPGFLTILDLVGAPAAWTKREVALTGLADRFPEDPEPEFVDIDARNIAAVTLQENNHVVLVNLADGAVISHWSAGTTTHAADTKEDDQIRFDGQIVAARREPDAIVWTPGGRLVTANEGDYDLDLAEGQFVGGRDFTLFEPNGVVAYEPGATLESEAAKAGLYPDGRSGSKGVEVEGVEIDRFDGVPFLFVGAERGHFVAVYLLTDERNPLFRQILPTGERPEGLLAIPRRNLFVTANEGDGTISVFLRDPSATTAP
jgi:DNA-binding beta-propeller fold protein YncE